MAARSRPRAGQFKDEVDEERSIWSSIRAEAKRVDSLTVKSDEVTKKIVELTEKQNAAEARGESPSAATDAELEKLLRENIRHTEEIQNLIESDSGNDILKSLEILAALRGANEPDPVSRAGSVGKSRDRNTKRKHNDIIDDRDSVAADSPAGGASPKVMISSKADRLLAKQSASSRAGSIPAAVRESSVKVEDGGDSADSLKVIPESHPSRLRLIVNTEVLYRNRQKPIEGEGILCRVTSVIGEGKQRRYEIIDADPDPPVPNQPYRASVNHLVPIPPPTENAKLGDLKKGAKVLGLYPGTTTFYKAEVVQAWSAKRREGSKGIKEEGKEGGSVVGVGEGLVRLRFEGEDEVDREMSVERRYVLPDK